MYSTLDYPYPPERPLPDDYLAYLGGQAESYDAPHLPPSLAAHPAPGPSPTP